MNAKLLTIHSREEQLLLTLLLTKPSIPLWLGMIRKIRSDGAPSDEFVLEDGRNVTFINRFELQPYDRNLNCGAIYTLQYNTAKWGFVDCERKLNFICEKDFGNV